MYVIPQQQVARKSLKIDPSIPLLSLVLPLKQQRSGGKQHVKTEHNVSEPINILKNLN